MVKLRVPGNVRGRAAGGGGGTTHDVTVTFRDCTDGMPHLGYENPTPGDPACPSRDDRIQSDGLGSYMSVDDVHTGIDGRGNFFLQIGKKNQPINRTLSWDFSDCASPEECTPPFQQDGHIPLLSTSGVNLRAMVIGAMEPLRLELTLLADGTSWQLFFNPFDMDCLGSPMSTSPVSVKRMDLKTWEIEAEQNDIACLLKVTRDADKFKGRYHMPFKVTVKEN